MTKTFSATMKAATKNASREIYGEMVKGKTIFDILISMIQIKAVKVTRKPRILLLKARLKSSPRVIAIIRVRRRVINVGLEIICEIHSGIAFGTKALI